MVRVNLIDPLYLTDQHLVAEYNEILMLISYLRRHPLRDYGIIRIPKRFTLGKGHMIFFKDKVLYLKRRHDSLRYEMGRRGYTSRRVVSIDGFPRIMLCDWSPDEDDVSLIKSRLIDKIKAKPWFYTYYRRKLDVDELIHLIESATWH
ncbi:MAG: pyrimidine dimer DNA glycosylase/endonuclease V [Candidatus Nitrosocaldus sp.]